MNDYDEREAEILPPTPARDLEAGHTDEEDGEEPEDDELSAYDLKVIIEAARSDRLWHKSQWILLGVSDAGSLALGIYKTSTDRLCCWTAPDDEVMAKSGRKHTSRHGYRDLAVVRVDLTEEQWIELGTGVLVWQAIELTSSRGWERVMDEMEDFWEYIDP